MSIFADSNYDIQPVVRQAGLDLEKQVEQLHAENKIKNKEIVRLESVRRILQAELKEKQFLVNANRCANKAYYAENKRLQAVMKKCIKAMKGSNCNELHWLEEALKGGE